VNPSESIALRHRQKEEQYRHEFAKTRMVEIPNFLPPSDATELADFLRDGMPKDWWYASTRPGSSNQPRYVRVTAHARESMTEAYKAALLAFDRGEFSYSFLRTNAHRAGCPCKLCRISSTIKARGTLDLIERITGAHLTGTSDFFASCYRPGDFLSPHSDGKVDRRMGIVLQLTRDWRPEYGGLLHFLPEEGDGVRRLISPSFNSACIFAIAGPGDSKHFVSHVVPGVRASRIAISGWYV
jgi:SM-20-related protein